MVEATSTKIDLASKDHGQSSFQAGSDAMVLDDFSTDSIDPDVEERLYSLIHHAKQQPTDGEVIMDDGVISIENNNLPQKQHQAGPANKPSNQVFYAEYSDSDDDTGIENINDGMMIYDSYAGSSIDGNSREKSTSQDRGSIIRVPGQPDIITLGSSDEEDSGFDQDIWHVDRVDLLIANSLSTERPPRKYCSRCRKKGNHCVKFCHLRPYITCHVCGNLGHMGDTCQNRVCFKCLENHRRGNCPPHSAPYCSICQVRGHPDVECPTHWRKFFNITNSIVSPDVYSVSMNKRKFCAICTLEHFTFECTQRQRAKGLFKNLDGLDISNQLNPSVKRKHPGNTLSPPNKRYRGGFVFQHQDSVSTQYHSRPSMSNFSFLPNMTRKERSLLRTDGFLRGSLNPDNGICFMGNPCYSLRNRQESRLPSSYYRDMRRAWKAKKRAVDFSNGSKKSKKKQKQSSNSATQTQPSSSSSNLSQPTPNASSTIAKIANGVSKKRKKNKGKKKNNNKLQPKSAAQLHSIKPEGSASTSAPKPLFPRTSGLIVID